MDIYLQLAIVMACIAIGGRFGGIGLGAAGGMGLCILTFFFHLKPDSPSISVIIIIISVITCVTILQAAGGLDLLVNLAERMLRKKPGAITFLGPFVCYIFSIMCGTSYVAFSVYPVVAEVATDAGIRPERAMSMSVNAANLALIASPISAVVAGMVGQAASLDISILDILLITVPGTFLGCLAGCLYVYKKGDELDQDKEFQRRLRTGEFVASSTSTKSIENMTQARIGLAIFLAGIFLIVLLSSVESLRPHWDGKAMPIATTLQILMLTTAALIMICCRIAPEKLHSGSAFKAGLIGVVGILGLSWMTGTYFETYNHVFVENFSKVLAEYPMLFGLILFVGSILIYSPSATVVTFVPLAVALDIPATTLIALMPAACAVFIIPGGSQIACASFDRTGTTRIGKYVIDHSYLLPGMVALIMSTVFCMLIAKLFF